MKKIVIFIVIILLALVILGFIFDWGREYNDIANLGTNNTASSSIQNSSSTSDMPIIVSNIKDNQEVSNPILINGRARGDWFLNGSFPVELVDSDGNTIASSTANALSESTTSNYIDFTANLFYTKSSSTINALIILSNNNTSGNQELDQSIFIPVTLK
jgi:uncharacterized alpha/beta hydrolase family protein